MWGGGEGVGWGGADGGSDKNILKKCNPRENIKRQNGGEIFFKFSVIS